MGLAKEYAERAKVVAATLDRAFTTSLSRTQQDDHDPALAAIRSHPGSRVAGGQTMSGQAATPGDGRQATARGRDDVGLGFFAGRYPRRNACRQVLRTRRSGLSLHLRDLAHHTAATRPPSNCRPTQSRPQQRRVSLQPGRRPAVARRLGEAAAVISTRCSCTGPGRMP